MRVPFKIFSWKWLTREKIELHFPFAFETFWGATITLLFYQIEPLKNGAFLVLPSSLYRSSSAPKATIIFQLLWGIFECCTNKARPSQPFPKNYQNGTSLFNPSMKIGKKLGQITFFEVLGKCHWMTLSKICIRLCPSAYPSG